MWTARLLRAAVLALLLALSATSAPRTPSHGPDVGRWRPAIVLRFGHHPHEGGSP